MMKTLNIRFVPQFVLGIALLMLCELALAAAGKIVFVAGPVTLERGAARAVKAGDAVETGDIIVTGVKARAQLLMADGARIALRSGSRFRVDEFSLPPAVNAPAQAALVKADGKSVASLLKGGFRTQTGAIGKVDRSAYEVRTPVGTLGIRGTDYTVVFCVGDCSDAPRALPGASVRDGLYLAVTEGSIVFRGSGQEIVLNAGEFLFIPLSGGRPEPLQTPPAFLTEDGAGPLTLGSRGAKQTAAASDLEGFSARRSPEESTGAVDGGGVSFDSSQSVQQPVTGTNANGGSVDLTGGGVPGRVAP